jgi:hypothetical protein
MPDKSTARTTTNKRIFGTAFIRLFFNMFVILPPELMALLRQKYAPKRGGAVKKILNRPNPNDENKE